jgi:hypothetical protein
MAKKRTINEIRQTKEYYTGNDTVKQIMAQQINEEMNPSKYTENDLEQAKCSIAEKIIKHFDDTLFEMVCDEMGKNYLFQEDNYLTEAGFDMFEDEWFEFFHEQHGDILHQVRQSIAN